CPYNMVFKEKIDIKPYSLLSFRAGDLIRGFIKVHGNKQEFVPEIVSRINEHSNAVHFKGHHYSVEEISVRKVEPSSFEWGDRVRIQSLSPLYLEKNERMEILPELSHILSASIRAYNRVCKFYARESYPYRTEIDLKSLHAPILDYDIKTVQIAHKSMEGKRILLKGISGNILYDTSTVSSEAGKILHMGSHLQIGKHSTYGFGGFMMKCEV
ncbi:CRISPR system precrRNA processing endoribonuclease RAMP protein Cas6, partial [Methanospirillum hungatei]|uniref:CRISPR system precrRNA processing endoribonuclease RAMP protein Cas6 n=1 Tax=Methanospirillum hungatei TaxID=2203 RepID=UPI0026EC285C